MFGIFVSVIGLVAFGSFFASDGDDSSDTDEATNPEETLGASQNNNTITIGQEGTDPDLLMTAANDFLQAGETSDRIEAGAGDDTILGGGGGDTILGGDGFDFLMGEDSEDRLRGNQSDDILIGGEGQDSLLGDNQDDAIWGAEIVDEVALKAAIDNGDDVTGNAIFNNFATFEETNAAGDTLDGGRGDDDIYIGAEDSVKGGAGEDEFFLGDWIEDGAGPAVLTDYTPADDAIVYLHDETQPDPVLTSSTDDANTVSLFADGNLVALIENAGPGFDVNTVVLMTYKPVASVL